MYSRIYSESVELEHHARPFFGFNASPFVPYPIAVLAGNQPRTPNSLCPGVLCVVEQGVRCATPGGTPHMGVLVNGVSWSCHRM